jgi:hypothetical protein
MNTKKEIRESLAQDLEKFTRSGGVVTVLKSKKQKVRNPANGHQKMTFSEKEPPKRIFSSWGLINGVF